MSKKVLSLFLALVICFTTAPLAFATETTTDAEYTYEITTTEVSITETETTEPVTDAFVDEDVTLGDDANKEETTEEDTDKEEFYDENEIVANLYVFLIETTVHPIGHTWVYVENLTDREIQVGLYTVPPYEGVSVGVLARKDGWGIYYNVESYAQTVHGMNKQISMKEAITAKKLEKVSNTIVNYVNHWDPFFNCMYFAFKVWNTGSYRILIPLLLPVFGKLQMALYRHERNVVMKPVTKEQTFRQAGFNSWATLVPATDRVLGPI